MSEDESAERLAERASRGDGDSFTALCGVLKHKLFRTAKGILGNETLALDAVSEAVFRAYRGIRRLREPRYAETWFIRIALNAAKDIKRRHRREISVESVPEGTHYDDHGEMEARELLETLPPELREIVSLKYFSGYTLAEIAVILTIPEGTVKSRLNRALTLLRREVADD